MLTMRNVIYYIKIASFNKCLNEIIFDKQARRSTLVALVL